MNKVEVEIREDLGSALRDVEKMRGLIHEIIEKEFRKEAVKAWVRHELEEVVGTIIWRATDTIANSILNEIREKIGNIDKLKREVIEEVSDRIYSKISLEDYFTSREIKDRVNEKISSNVARKVELMIDRELETYRAKVREVIEKSLPDIKKELNKILESNLGEIVVRQIGILLDEVRHLKEDIRRIEERLRSIKI